MKHLSQAIFIHLLSKLRFDIIHRFVAKCHTLDAIINQSGFTLQDLYDYNFNAMN